MTRPRTLAVTTDTQIVDNTIYTEPAILFDSFFILYPTVDFVCQQSTLIGIKSLYR